MIERFYQILDSVGYTEPLHPAVVHIPMGLLIGACLLGLLSLFLRHPVMGRAARYALIVAFVFLFPTLLLGYIDWQHFFAGGWLFPLKVKLILAGLLFLFALAALISGRGETTSRSSALLYTLCVLTVVGLGYFGGKLVYAGKTPAGPPQVQRGEKLFHGNCSGCHPYGGNIVDRDAPLRGSPELKDAATFLRWIRDPRLDSGARGVMPPFPPSRVSDAQAAELHRYIVNVIEARKEPEKGGSQAPTFSVRTDAVSIDRGRQLFETHCTRCHTVNSQKTIVGPGLQGILKRPTLPASGRPAIPENIFRQLRIPYNDMPSFDQNLTDDQVFDLIAFLNTR